MINKAMPQLPIMQLQVSEIRDETADTKTVQFRLEQDLPFLPGQFITLTAELWNPRRERPAPVHRAFSITSSPTDRGILEIAAKRYPDGRMSAWLHDALKPGDAVAVKGPQGGFVFKDGETDQIVLVAGGIGIAPFRSVIRYIDAKRLPIGLTLLYSARTPADFAFGAELRAVARSNPRIRCVFTITRPTDLPWTERIGRIDGAMLKEHLGGPGALYYICGPDALIQETAQQLKGLEVPLERIRTEKW
jgi:ferredoxin-NADP reductase